MNLYEPKHLADSMRVVRKNTIAIAEDIPEAQYDYRPTQDSRSVRETLLHMASMTLFDLHIHEDARVRAIADQVLAKMRTDPHTRQANEDWESERRRCTLS